MAKYTTQLKTIIESGYKLFDFDYPIFDENYRSVLETKIIRRYFFREIGFETVAHFKYMLDTRLNEIMPYYNKRYEGYNKYLTYDPYKNKDVTTEEKRVTEGIGNSHSTGQATSTSTGNGKEIFHDTPSSKLGNKDYATNMTDTTSEGENVNTSSGQVTGDTKTTDEFITRTFGHDGMKYPSDILKDVEKSYLNIDVEILEELSDLFLNLY